MSERFHIPEDLARTRSSMGQAEAAWLGTLPSILADLEQRWSLTLGPPFTRLSYNYAAPAVRSDGTAAVLKVCFPDREFYTEAEALRLFDGRGSVQLLEADLGQGALLLERLEPGAPLLGVSDDDEATRIAAAVMRRLWRHVPADHPFPTVADWARGFSRLRGMFGGTTGPLPAGLVGEAQALFADLIASMPEPVLLHGGLNYGNVLSAQREPWLAIDPKGVVDEPAYETGVLLRDPLPELLVAPQPARVLAGRVELLAEVLGFDRERLRSWGLAQAVLSAIWTVEDHGEGWEPAIACAQLLSTIRA